MTTAERLSMLKSILNISDTSKDAMLTVYLDFAKRELIAWRYGYNANPIARITESEDVAVALSIGTFIGALSPTSGTSYVFTYSESAESWTLSSVSIELADFGLTYPDDTDPVDAETITVKYSESALAEFDTVMVMAVVNGYSQQGAEGQTAHSENGISRVWKHEDMVAYIRANVGSMVGVA
jgi:hypothetical protein